VAFQEGGVGSGVRDKIPRNEILTGEAEQKLSELPDSSVDTAMTIPPYWCLRDYGHEDQLGLESSPEKYVENLMSVFNELQRVLKPTGTFFLNVDDSYGNPDTSDKCMAMVPERVMMAMVDNGWILRNKICWTKPNPMPESVKDRFSNTWEYVYMFSLNKNYYFDLDAVREPHSVSSKKRLQQNNGNPNFDPKTEGRNLNGEENLNVDELCHQNGKNPGDTWELTTANMPEAHFAVYPEELCEKPVKAGCPKKVCAECGTPYERKTTEKIIENRQREEGDWVEEKPAGTINSGLRHEYQKKGWETLGFEPVCECETEETEKGVILDPFAGEGTTGLVARKFNRNYLGIELNEDYADMARERIRKEIGEKAIDEFVGDTQ